MKTVLRIAALSLVVAGALAAYSAPRTALASHQSATAAEPTPTCAECNLGTGH